MRRIFLNIIVLVSLVAGMAACSKNGDNQPGPAHMRWINVTPGMAFDIYSNGENIYKNLQFDSSTGYASGLPSFYYLQIKQSGTSDTVVNGRQQLQSGLYYSMFIVPDTLNGQISATKASAAIVTENAARPAIDTMKLRFYNFAPFSPAINVVMTIDGRINASDTLRPFSQRIFNDQSTYSSYSTYITLMAFNWKVHFYNASTSKLIDSFHYKFSSQTINTMYLKPVPGKSGADTFDYKVIQTGY